MKKLIKEFSAYSEKGEKFNIIVYKNFIDTSDKDSFHLGESLPGIMEFWTSYGQIVNRIEKGRYQIVDSGIYLISDDPNAM